MENGERSAAMIMHARWGFSVGLTVLAVLLAVGIPADAADLPGSVAAVVGLDVWIRLDVGGSPRPGDLVDISFSLPGGEQLSIGSWRVVEVREDRIFAEVVSNTGRPAVGQQAVVHAMTARAPTPQPQWHAPPPPTPTRGVQGPAPVAPGVQRSSQLPIEIQQLVDALFSGSSREERGAAKQLYLLYRNEEAVQRAAERALLAGYRTAPEDAEHVDAMSWLCKILGEPGDGAYVVTLVEVGNNAPNAKLRKFAERNLHVAAKRLYRRSRDEVGVQQAAEEALLAGYRSGVNDGKHVDAMSWLCNILGESGDGAYAATLEEVAANAPSPKLRKYAQKNLTRVR